MNDQARHDLTVSFLQSTHGLTRESSVALVRFLQAVHGLPMAAAVALARETTLAIYLWLRLPELYEAGMPVRGVPALFAGARGKAMIDGLAAFTARYGGQRLYMPQRLTPEHPFCQVAGSEAAARLVELYGGKPLVVPMAEALLRPIRDRALVDDYLRGASLNELSERYGLAYPFVCAMTRGARNERKAAIAEAQAASARGTKENRRNGRHGASRA